MPRLTGKQANSIGPIALLLIAIAVLLGSLEYVGVVDFIPGFGRVNSQFTVGQQKGY